jgi:dienelactone hydrolase
MTGDLAGYVIITARLYHRHGDRLVVGACMQDEGTSVSGGVVELVKGLRKRIKERVLHYNGRICRVVERNTI